VNSVMPLDKRRSGTMLIFNNINMTVDNCLSFLSQITGDTPPAHAMYFVLRKVSGPFELYIVVSANESDGKCIAANKDGSLSFKPLNITEPDSSVIFLTLPITIS